MKSLVIGSGMMGSAAAYDMARQPDVQTVTLAETDTKRAREVAARINRLRGDRKVKAVSLDASDQKATAKLMKGTMRPSPRFPTSSTWAWRRRQSKGAVTLPTWAATTPSSDRNWRCQVKPKSAG